MNLIEILPNIYGVKVPLIWYDFAIENGSNMITFKINDGFNDEVAGQTINLGHYNTFKNDFKILGTITATEISFDASEVVEKSKSNYNDTDSWTEFYDYKTKNYFNINVGINDERYGAEQSFRSALPKEIFFENPFEKPETYLQFSHFKESANISKEDMKLCKQYQTAQQNLTEKLLILQKIN